MNWYKKAQYEYIGDCRDTVDELEMWDATEMAQTIENSNLIDPQTIIPFINDYFGEKISANPNNFEAGEFQNIVWIYDLTIDIHYFFGK